MKKSIVSVDGVKYVVTQPATDEIFESTVMGVSETIKTVHGKGYKLDGDPNKLYEIQWMVDGDLDSKSVSDWVQDWDTADAVFELD
ncbi:hypothetical protein [Secundilactobacillus silagei]|uniref:Uncharacterized protein n=1 Tax=Secundilactobacillus silagei JCM 19001 TaxID=1302250 RepID=A0A1Z5II89_9LACO|nr:hypothetical protein [Secundilactobacillus silagei]TDG67405.1 hypothetical protein C5L25_001001 [Secundilactobacillus silagei JCM 19001]GAX01348.1 hypothetical protein IWT126_01374 [Secundilactobacillus silagei JCM 19001]